MAEAKSNNYKPGDLFSFVEKYDFVRELYAMGYGTSEISAATGIEKEEVMLYKNILKEKIRKGLERNKHDSINRMIRNLKTRESGEQQA